MAISDEVQALQTNLTNSYTAVSNKGGTLPQDQCFDNLPDAINTISTGGTINSLNVTPTTSAQTITATGGVDGFSPVNVSAVDASIDSNIQANNILDGVTILSVTGNVVELNATSQTVNPTTSQQTITPTSPYNAFDSVTVNAVTSAIDNSIQPENIKKDVVILGTTGTYEGSGGVGITREVSATGVYQMPAQSFTFALPSNATDLGDYALYYAFYYNSGITNADLSSLTTISGYYAMGYAFYNCTGLTSVDLSSLITISGEVALSSTFRNCSALISVDLGSLTLINNAGLSSCFNGCSSLTNVDLSSLTTISGSDSSGTGRSSNLMSMFANCTSLTNIDLSSLITITNGICASLFSGCTSLTSADLSSLTFVGGREEALYRAFYGCTNLANVNFNSLQIIGLESGTSSNNWGHFAEAFYNCELLTSLTFPNLEKIYYTSRYDMDIEGTFYNCNKVQKMYFPKLNTINNRIAFKGCSSLTELHFGASNQSAIEASPGYSTAWGRGAGNVTIYFDL